MPALILATIILFPVVLLLLLRSNSAVVFLAVCAGVVLQQAVGSDLSFDIDLVFTKTGPLVKQILNIALIAVPPFCAAIFLRKKVSRLKLFLNIIPAAAVGLTLAAYVVPQLSPITKQNIVATQLWKISNSAQGIVTGVGVFASLLLLRTKSSSSKEHSKHHK